MDINLGQTLLVKPEVPYSQIEQTLKAIGWQLEQQPTEAPLIAEEPEFSSWSWRGHKPYVIYTFNPVVKMRVLDVATLPPMLRGAIASQLPIFDSEDIEDLMRSADTRKRLLGLWAARETERLDLILSADRLSQDHDQVLAQQAREVRDRLQHIDQSRIEMLANLRLLTEAAPQLIQKMTDPAVIRQLKPSDEEVTGLFDAELAPVVTKAVESIYQKRLRISLEAETRIEVFALPAGLLRWQNMLSEKFPGGYRDIAGWMHPKKIWMCWTLFTPQGGTVRYDGLVWLDGEWRWLPKIYRYLTPYLLEEHKAYQGRH